MGSRSAFSSAPSLSPIFGRALFVLWSLSMLPSIADAQSGSTRRPYPDISWKSSYSIPGIVGRVSMGGKELCAKMEEHCEEENAEEGGHGRTRDLINEYLAAGDDFCRQFNRTYEEVDLFGCRWRLTEKYRPIKPEPATNPDGTLDCPSIRKWCETYAGSASMKGDTVTVTPSRFICWYEIKQEYIGGCDPSVWDRVGGKVSAEATLLEEALLYQIEEGGEGSGHYLP